ncbi:MAG: 1-deoxy-D-xylulose 5-phosphate reductoisomerase [Thermoanaerobacterales bacterium 50_218]|nr:MAG: 1-deoxy-D-xylulose 5-phosphate reductoisomerase [Thermoanaerobacterales bacterium 50_218]HAA90280.1 1-deoxy-D-xylulose-5-phosphate reductoisomerase [Peptococcaceae bacterium]
MKDRRKVVILGSTGSIGRQALEVISWFPDLFQVIGLAAHRNISLLEEQVRAFRPAYVGVVDPEAGSLLEARLQGSGITCFRGVEGLLELVQVPTCDLVLVAVTGVAGLRPTLAAIEAGKTVALANKETLVVGGDLVIEATRRRSTQIIPVDSEHSAIFQCLQGSSGVAKVILTGSGGPFRGYSRKQLEEVTPEMALRHPTWKMGPKITIDSATLMNKGLEVIEAKWLFGLEYEQIEVLIHPQSIVHGLVVFQDGAVLAQLGQPDMRIPIQYALLFPERRKNRLQPLDLAAVGALTFEKPDLDNFPCLRLAWEAGKTGGTMPAVLNAANEVAVSAFLEKRIPFLAIPEVVARVMEQHSPEPVSDLSTLLEADQWARRLAHYLITTNY